MNTVDHLNNKSRLWSWMKFAFAFVASASICVSAEGNSQDEILFAGWGPYNSDSLYYLPSQAAKREFERYWKFKNLKSVFAACGYTYDVFKSNKFDPVVNIASVNIPCSTVVVNGGTYFGQMKPVWRALTSARVGKISIDTIIDSVQLGNWLKAKQSNPQFLGYEFNSEGYVYAVKAEMPLRHDSLSPMKNDTIESFRKFYARVIEKSKIRYEEIMGFKVCEGSGVRKDSTFLICSVGGVEILEAVSKAGFKVDSTRIGMIIKWYHK